ncbi:hypothetical protein HRbin36_02405 [bacterium HR36]|nr:hypothetical protein HRbin36_02405 [bacterium HR36]
MLALVVATAQTSAPHTADRVNLVNKQDTRGTFSRRLEQIPHATGTYPDEHLDKLRTIDTEEGDAGFSGHRTRQQRFAGTGRADQQDPFRNLPPQTLKLFWIAEKLNDFLKFSLGMFHVGHVIESHAHLPFIETSCRAFNVTAQESAT